MTRIGREREVALLGEVERGAYRLESFSARDVASAVEMIEQHADFPNLGLADASNVVLAERYDARNSLTLDERLFRSLTDSNGQPFRLLPADL